MIAPLTDSIPRTHVLRWTDGRVKPLTAKGVLSMTTGRRKVVIPRDIQADAAATQTTSSCHRDQTLHRDILHCSCYAPNTSSPPSFTTKRWKNTSSHESRRPKKKNTCRIKTPLAYRPSVVTSPDLSLSQARNLMSQLYHTTGKRTP